MVKEQYRLIVGWLGVYALDLLKAIFFPNTTTIWGCLSDFINSKMGNMMKRPMNRNW